ncbi:glycosyl transferase, partial [Rhizobium johnstonii]
PFAFFSAISATFMLASLGFMSPVLAEYFETGLVSRMPTWLLSTALLMISFMLFTAGVILDSVSRSRAEQLRIHYMGLERPSALKS